MKEEEFLALLTAKDKANSATPRLQTALLGIAALAAALAVLAALVFTDSVWVRQENVRLMTAPSSQEDWLSAYYSYYAATLVVVAAFLVVAGSHFDFLARTRTVLMSTGAGLMMAMGLAITVFFDASRPGLQRRYQVGMVGSRSEFAHFVYAMDAFALLIAACGVAVLVLMELQRRRIAAAYPA